jgi:hypothetical protein
MAYALCPLLRIENPIPAVSPDQLEAVFSLSKEIAISG